MQVVANSAYVPNQSLSSFSAVATLPGSFFLVSLTASLHLTQGVYSVCLCVHVYVTVHM